MTQTCYICLEAGYGVNLPKNLERRKVWLDSLGLNADCERFKGDKIPRTHICFKHFDEKYINTEGKMRTLRKG